MVWDRTYPEAVVQETEDDRVHETVGHGQPVAGEEVDKKEVGVLADHTGVGDDDQVVEVEREPGADEEEDYHHQHLDDLRSRRGEETEEGRFQ